MTLQANLSFLALGFVLFGSALAQQGNLHPFVSGGKWGYLNDHGSSSSRGSLNAPVGS